MVPDGDINRKERKKNMNVKKGMRSSRENVWTSKLALVALLFSVLLITGCQGNKSAEEVVSAEENVKELTKETAIDSKWSEAKRYEMNIGGYLEDNRVASFNHRLYFNGSPDNDKILLSLVSDAGTKYSYSVPMYVPTVKGFEVVVPKLNWKITIVDFDTLEQTLQIDIQKMQ